MSDGGLQPRGRMRAATIAVLPLTPARWPDLEEVFGARGCSVARSCWCMAYRRSGATQQPPAGVKRSEFNRAGLQSLVAAGRPPGLIGYLGKKPVGWISLGPRKDFARLERSPLMKPVDDRPVWSVICFVVPPEHRRKGVAHGLLRGAIAWARKRGATLIEAYPVDKRGPCGDETLWFGTRRMFDRAGFKVVARRKPTRPVVRLKLR